MGDIFDPYRRGHEEETEEVFAEHFTEDDLLRPQGGQSQASMMVSPFSVPTGISPSAARASAYHMDGGLDGGALPMEDFSVFSGASPKGLLEMVRMTKVDCL